MPRSSLEKLIETKLKENITVNQIRNELKILGYSLDEINKSITEAIKDVGSKRPTDWETPAIVTAVMITIAIGLLIAFWTPTATERAETTVVEQTVPAINIPPGESLKTCDDFTEPLEETSCVEAVALVLANFKGDVTRIDQKTISLDENQTAKSYWFVSLILTNPVQGPNNATYSFADVLVDPVGKNLTLYSFGN